MGRGGQLGKAGEGSSKNVCKGSMDKENGGGGLNVGGRGWQGGVMGKKWGQL